MKTTIKTNELVAVNNSSSKTNKIFNVVMMVLLLLSPILVSCQNNSNSNCEDFSEPFKVNLKEYKNYNPNKGTQKNVSFLASEPGALFIFQLDEKLGFELWDFRSDEDDPDMFIELPFDGLKLSNDLIATPIVATFPGDFDRKNPDKRDIFLSSKNKDMWFVDLFENGHSYHYIYTKKDKNNPRILVETVLNVETNIYEVRNILIRKDVSEKDLNEFTYKQTMGLL